MYLKFLGDSLLYTEAQYCLTSLRQLSSVSSTKKEMVHFYWRGPISAKVTLCLKSFLATQDLTLLSPVLWLDTADDIEQIASHLLLEPFIGLVELRRLDFALLAKGTPLENATVFGTDAKAAARSDFFRLLVLYRYGGYYSDLDVVFLRDISILAALYPRENILFQWSGESYATNAFARADAESLAIEQVMIETLEKGTCHPRVIFPYTNANADFLVLPVTFFSPLWLHVDRRSKLQHYPFAAFRDFFQPRARQAAPVTLENLFPGAFTYHWHNFWNHAEYGNSPAGQLNTELDALLAEKFALQFPDTFSAV